MDSTVTFEINDDTGEMTMHVEGIAGPACEEAVKLVAEKLGQPTDERFTEEYYQRQIERTRVGGY